MIVLFTDFGSAGPYTGQLQAVLQQQAPGVPVISLFADLTPFDIQAAAYLLPAYTQGFAPGSVFVCVVDPGVGSERPAVVVQADGRWYVGPNEGLFALLVRRAASVRCWQIEVPATASASFHGRDVFAPLAAQLARGAPLAIEEVALDSLAQPDWPDDLWRVVYIDRYGNAITGLRAGRVARSADLEIDGQRIHYARTFSAMADGEVCWYENANGLVEFAVNRGRADRVAGLDTTSRFSLHSHV